MISVQKQFVAFRYQKENPMLTNVPLMIVPFIVYNIFALGFFGDNSIGSDVWANVIMSVNMAFLFNSITRLISYALALVLLIQTT